MLGSVKVGDKLRVQIKGTTVYFLDGGTRGEMTAHGAGTAPDLMTCTARVPAETDKTQVPAQRWPVRDVDLMAPNGGGIVTAEVTAVRMVRRA